MKEILAQAVRQITIGQGGADVYELSGGRIAKHIRKETLTNEGAWAQYMREAQFYARHMGENRPFLPEIFCSEWNADEILIVMRKYLPLDRQALDDALLEKIMAVLAQVHALPMAEEAPAQPQMLDDRQLTQCTEGWHGVLAEHEGAFDADLIDAIASQINDVNRKKFISRRVCGHGDFHFENLLTDEAGNIIVCDWQNVTSAHPAADIAFMLSRLAADGVKVDCRRAMEMYCRHSAEAIAPEEIDVQMRLSNLNTSFGFWHYFLHGAPEERVREIFDKMAADFAALTKG